MFKVSLCAAIIALAGLAHAAPNKTAIEKAYTTALKKPDAKMQTTFFKLSGQALELYRKHKVANRNPSVAMLKGKSAVAKSTFAILADTDRFGLIAVFSKRTQKPVAKGSVYTGPQSTPDSKVNWIRDVAEKLKKAPRTTRP